MANDTTALLSIPEERLPDFRAKFEKLNRKATKNGLPLLTLTARGTSERPIKPNSKLTRTIYHYGVTLASTFGLDGYTLLGVIDYLPDGSPIVREVPGNEVPAKFRVSDRTCAHCKLDRYRKETFIVRNADGSTARVGRNCLALYLGMNVERMLRAAEWLRSVSSFNDDDSYGGFSDRRRPTYSPAFLLKVAARTIAVDGYFSKTTAAALNDKYEADGSDRRAFSTAENVDTYIAALHGWLGHYTDQYGVRHDLNKEVLDKYGEVNDADIELAGKVLDYAKTQNGDSTYAYNLRTIANAELVTGKELGILVSAFSGFKREAERAAEVKTVASTYLGTIGSKLTVPTATVVGVRSFDGSYGPTTLLTFVTPDGNVLKWFATGVRDYTHGTAVALKGTVKNHEEYKGIKATMLTRVTVDDATTDVSDVSDVSDVAPF